MPFVEDVVFVARRGQAPEGLVGRDLDQRMGNGLPRWKAPQRGSFQPSMSIKEIAEHEWIELHSPLPTAEIF